jgi:multisubunit Na+/H+ antiporter MnhF subunit
LETAVFGADILPRRCGLQNTNWYGEQKMNNLTLNRFLWLITGGLSLVAAAVGVINSAIYEGVVSSSSMPGVLTQDMVVIAAALLLLILTAAMRESAVRAQILVLGILGFLFYAYGIYAIERIYNALYPIYLAIVSLSFYSLAYGAASIGKPFAEGLRVPPLLRTISAAYAIFIAAMFNVIWISQLVPLLRTGERIEYTYSIYIIDLCFIMPAFLISAILALRNKDLGMIGLPALFIVGVGILSPLALAEVVKPPLFDQAMEGGSFWLYFILSVVFLLLAILYLGRAKRTLRQE